MCYYLYSRGCDYVALEPLLKDEEEKIVFRNTKNNKKRSFKFNKSIIFTILVTILVLYIFGNTFYGFYLGFKYYGVNNESDPIVEVIEEENIVIDDNIKSIYNKIRLSNCTNSISLLKRFYSKSLTAVELTTNEKITLVLDSFIKNNCVTDMLITKENFNNAAISLLNDANLVNEVTNTETNYNNFLVRYDSLNDSFIITQDNCDCGQDFVIQELIRASSKGDEIYIYERYGYFSHNVDNTYNLYGDLMNLELLASNLNITSSANFTDKNLLKTYKWTFKKGTDDNYYFISVAQVNS